MKLRSHLVALVVFAVLPLVVFSVIVVILFANHERASTDRSLRLATRALSLAVDSVLEDSRSALTALTASDSLRRGDYARFHSFARRAVAQHAGWISIALIDAAGREVLDTITPYGARRPAAPERPYVKRVVTTGAPAVSGLIADPAGGPPHVVVAVPVRAEKGDVTHALLAALSTDAVNVVLAAQRVPSDWIGTVVDASGLLLGRTADPERHVGRPVPERYRELTRDLDEGSSRDTSPEGIETYTAFRRLRLADWTVAIAIPASLVEAPLRRFVMTIAFGGLIFLVIGILLAGFLGRRIARPIAALESSAEAVGRGAVPAPLTDSTVTEVLAVGRSLVTAAERRREIEAERTGLLAREQEARAEAERLQARYAFLAEVSIALASSLDYQQTLRSLARLAVPRLADLCIIDLVDDAGAIERVAAAHVDPARQPLADELQRRFPPDRRGRHPVAQALATGEAQLATHVADADLEAIASAPEHARIAAELGYRSYLVVPLVARGRTLGAISLITTESGRRYVADDVPLAEDLARRAGLAVDNARLLAESARRQRAAEALAAVGRFLGTALDPTVVGERIAESVRALLGLQASIFYSVDPDTLDMTPVASAGNIGTAVDRTMTLPAGTATVGLAVRDRRAVATPDFTTDERLRIPESMRARLTSAPYRSVLAVPLLTYDRVVAVLALGDAPGREFTSEEIVLAQGFADQAALALENARLYAEAREANRAKDEFLATLSHELRTPLTAMLGWVRMLQSGRLDNATRRRALEVIDRNTKLQAQLIDDLLDVSRIITGKLHLEIHAVDLIAVIEGAIDAVVQGAEAKGIALRRELDPSAGPVWGDPHRLQQVVWNLLSNAIKFTPAGGTVEVRLERVNDMARVIVRDTGRGIHPDFLPFMFDRFRQADSTSTRAYGGLGVGLSIVRHLVELHRGTVRADSAGEGRGATFTVMLPVAQAPAPPADARRPSIDRFPTLTGVRVLVVDDESDARELLSAVLEQSGAEVTAAASAAEALETLAEIRPHVIVSDISMPDMDGYALITRVRALGLDRGGRIPAVALSAYARAEDRARAIAVGFQVHVPKPVEPAELVDVVARLAGRGGGD